MTTALAVEVPRQAACRQAQWKAPTVLRAAFPSWPPSLPFPACAPGGGLSPLSPGSLLPAVSPLAILTMSPRPLLLQHPPHLPARARVPLCLGSSSPSFHGASSPMPFGAGLTLRVWLSCCLSLTFERWLLNPSKP